MKILLSLCALSGTEGLRKRMPLERKFVGFQQCQDSNPLGRLFFKFFVAVLLISDELVLENCYRRLWMNNYFIKDDFLIPDTII